MIPNNFIFGFNGHTYHIPLKYKINHLFGDAAIGKTTLIDLVNSSRGSGVVRATSNMDTQKIRCNISIADLDYLAQSQEECLVILDESNETLKLMLDMTKTLNTERKRVLKFIKESNCVLICLTREIKSRYPLPQDAILEMHNSSDGWTHTAIPYFADQNFAYNTKAQFTVCEDETSGLDFIKSYIAESDQVVKSSKGIENLAEEVHKYPKDTNIIFDYLSAGHIVDILPKILEEHPYICNWYSFEWYVAECLNILDNFNAIMESNNVYNKEEAIADLLRKYIIYKKEKFENSTSCIVPQDCNGKVKCPHNSPMSLSSTVRECPLATKEKRKELFSSYVCKLAKIGITSLF